MAKIAMLAVLVSVMFMLPANCENARDPKFFFVSSTTSTTVSTTTSVLSTHSDCLFISGANAVLGMANANCKQSSGRKRRSLSLDEVDISLIRSEPVLDASPNAAIEPSLVKDSTRKGRFFYYYMTTTMTSTSTSTSTSSSFTATYTISLTLCTPNGHFKFCG